MNYSGDLKTRHPKSGYIQKLVKIDFRHLNGPVSNAWSEGPDHLIIIFRQWNGHFIYGPVMEWQKTIWTKCGD
jgi:hypothetical protein